ncbi:hypothetical protein FACS189423_11070 [Bacteroidia bacterium]|nr:hypothetical protein FACS189423_11070 [Bacteroidia bacterium]
METPKNKAEKEQILDFIKLCLQHWYYFVISGAVCLALGILYLKVTAPVFSVVAEVALRHDDSLVGQVGKGSGSGILSAIGLGSGRENIEDETIKMRSQGNIRGVIKALDLNKVYKLSEFGGLSKTDLYDQSPIVLSVDSAMSDTIVQHVKIKMNVKKDGSATVKIKYGKKQLGKFQIASFPTTINTAIGPFTLSQSSYYQDFEKPFNLRILYTNYDFITQLYRKFIEIDFEKKNSDLISLTMNNPNVIQAKAILLETIDNYNKNWSTDKEYVYVRTLDFIEKRLGLTKYELSEADRQIQEFKDKYNLTDVEADVTYYFKMSGEVQAALLETETQLNLADIIREFVQKEDNKYNLIPFNLSASSDAGVSEIIEKYNEAVLRRNDLYKTTTQSALAQSLDNQLDAQRKNIIVSLDNAKKGWQTALETIKKKDREINKKIGTIPSVERDYISLKREQELQQTIYIFLLEKREEAAVRAAELMPKLKIIDEPYVINDPVSPSLMKVALAVLFFGGIFIPLGLIYGIPYLKTLRRKED